MTDVTDESACPAFNHLDPGLQDRLYDTYQDLREKCPVARSDAWGGYWVLSRYDDVVRVLKDHRKFSSAQGVTLPHAGWPVPAIPTESDPPRHSDYRNVLMPFLAPGRVRELAPFIRDLINELIDRVGDSGECDALQAFARPIPGLVVGRLLGYSDDDAMQCVTWMNAMFEAGGRGDAQGAANEAGKLVAYIQTMVDQRIAHPGDADDVITAIVQAVPPGGRFDNDECVGLLFTSTVGAVETTVNAIGHLLHYVGSNEQIKAQLIAEPDLIQRAVEEALRIEAPAQQDVRTVVESVTIGGQPMEPGDKVMLLWGSANRDERQFTDPETFRLDRSKNPHVSFSWGIHKCAGMHLARLELTVVLEEVLRRIPDFAVDTDGVEGPSLVGGISWHLDRLPIRFAASASRSSMIPSTPSKGTLI